MFWVETKGRSQSKHQRHVCRSVFPSLSHCSESKESCSSYQEFAYQLVDSIQFSLQLFIQSRIYESFSKQQLRQAMECLDISVNFDVSEKNQFLLVLCINQLPSYFLRTNPPLSEHLKNELKKECLNMERMANFSGASNVLKSSNRFPIIPFSSEGVRFFSEITRLATSIVKAVAPHTEHQIAVNMSKVCRVIDTLRPNV